MWVEAVNLEVYCLDQPLMKILRIMLDGSESVNKEWIEMPDGFMSAKWEDNNSHPFQIFRAWPFV